MGTFVPFSRDQSFLLPPDMRDWLPEDEGDAAVGAVWPAAEVLSTPRCVIGAVDAYHRLHRPRRSGA